MLSFETTDAFGKRNEKVVVSDAETVKMQEQELETVRNSLGSVGAKVFKYRGHHGRRVLRFPQRKDQIKAMRILVRWQNDEFVASAPSVDGKRV